MALAIYLLAETRIASGLEEFLSARKLKWQQDDVRSDAEQLVEVAGRVCYMSFGERQFRSSNQEYVDNLLKQGHESVLEHANFTLLADGISRALSHQLVRHRIGFSYSQLSQQYCDKTPLEWVTPPELSRNPKALDEWKNFIQLAEKTYAALLASPDSEAPNTGLTSKEARRLNRSLARSVLPNAAATILVVSGNARAWRHLLNVRGDIPGDLEMRQYCVKVFEVLRHHANHLFSDFEIAEDSIGQFVRRRSQS